MRNSVAASHKTVMKHNQIDKCPGCGGPLEHGFSHKACGLSFVAASKFRSFAFVDEDLNKRTWRQRLLPSPARYCPSHLCRACGLYLVDYETTLSRKEANAAAASLEPRTGD